MRQLLSRPLTRSLTHPAFVAATVFLLGLVLALAPLRIALGVAGVILAGVLAWLGPVWGVYFAILSVPIQQHVLLPGGTSFTQAAVLLMAGSWLLRVAVQPRRVVVTGPLFWAWLALIGALFLSASFTPYSLVESLKAAARWVIAFLVWFVAVNTITKRWQLVGLIACLLAAPAAAALIGLYQFVSGDGPPSFRISESLPFVRAYGTIGQPNSFAGYINMAWPLALALLVGVGTGEWRSQLGNGQASVPCFVRTAAFAPVAGVLCAALAVSFSLGGWVGALLGCVGLMAGLGRRWAFAALGGTGGLILFLLLGGARLLPEVIAGRLTRLTGMLNFFDPATVTVTPENFSLVERMAQMKAGLLMFLSHPLVGVGPGSYTLAYGDVASAPWYASRGHAHNFYLHMAAEAGVVGIAAYLMLMSTALFLAIRLLQRKQTTLNRSITIGCCGIIAAVIGHNMFENLHVLNLGVQLSGIWAIVSLLPRLTSADAGGSRLG